VYFGTGSAVSVYEDIEDVGHAYAEISNYKSFGTDIGFYLKPGGGTWG